MGYSLHAIGSPVVWISISNRFVLPTFVEDLDMMLSNSFQARRKGYPYLLVALVHPVILLTAYLTSAIG